MIDLRSDTVTLPTPAMREAMANAELGDDVFGEDPTVNRLERMAAEQLGKEAALFVASGTMGNQIAVHLQTSPGDEVLCNEWAHVRNHEHGAASWLSGVSFRSVEAPTGLVTEEHVAAAAGQSGYHLPGVTLLVWENTHNVSGGTCKSNSVKFATLPLSSAWATRLAATRCARGMSGCFACCQLARRCNSWSNPRLTA